MILSIFNGKAAEIYATIQLVGGIITIALMVAAIITAAIFIHFENKKSK